MNNLPRKTKAEKNVNTLSDEDLLRLYDIISAYYNDISPRRKQWKAKVGTRLWPLLDEIAKRGIWFKEH